MPTIFDYISDVMFTKKTTHLCDIEVDRAYNLFMMNRWISMHSPDSAHLVNLTTNRLHSVFSTKKDSYTFLFNILPKSKFTKIQYIKKPTEPTDSKAILVKFLAKKLELSEREINYYIEENKIDLTRYKKLWEYKE